MADDPSGVPGQLGLFDNDTPFNRHDFHVQQAIGQLGTMRLAVVKKTTPVGETDIAGTVDIQPITKMVDGQGNSQEHGTIQQRPHNRIQSGGSALIMDPQVGDIVTLGIPDRDISSNIAARGPATPGSRRRADLSDAIVTGHVLNKKPTQWIRPLPGDAGWEIQDSFGNHVKMDAGGVKIKAAVGFVFLGGDGDDGTYAFVETVSGPSSVVKAKL